MTLTRKSFITSLLALGVGGSLHATPTPTEKAMPKILIAYYSWSGNTRKFAQKIQANVGGDLFEIRPAKPYPTDYNITVEQGKAEIRAGITPQLKALYDNLADYDTVFIGSPNWWGTMAPPVKTFLQQSDLAGKRVIPFFTHGGGGMQRCERDVSAACKGATLLPALTCPGSSVSDNRILPWLEKLALK